MKEIDENTFHEIISNIETSARTLRFYANAPEEIDIHLYNTIISLKRDIKRLCEVYIPVISAVGMKEDEMRPIPYVVCTCNHYSGYHDKTGLCRHPNCDDNCNLKDIS